MTFSQEEKKFNKNRNFTKTLTFLNKKTLNLQYLKKFEYCHSAIKLNEINYTKHNLRYLSIAFTR